MGSTESPPTSFRITIGIWLTGSSNSPRTVISTSIVTSEILSPYTTGYLILVAICATDFEPSHHQANHLPNKRIREAARHQHGNVRSDYRNRARRHGEVQRLVLRRPSDPLGAAIVVSFNHYFTSDPDISLVTSNLNLPLPRHQDFQPP